MPPLDLSLAINVRTGEERVLAKGAGLAEVASDYSVLGIDAPAIRGKDFFDDHKGVLDTMDDHGWTVARAFDHDYYGLIGKVEPVRAEDLATVLDTLVGRAGRIPVDITVTLREAGAIDLRGEDIEAVMDGGPVPERALARCAGQARRIASIMDTLESTAGASRVTVFGSVARGKPFPNDLDILVDARDGVAFDAEGLLRLARDNYGAFDPFVLREDGLFVRDASATGFVRAMSAATILASVRADGIPLSGAPRPSMSLPEASAPSPGMR